jgi:signal transduction histidine kinase
MQPSGLTQADRELFHRLRVRSLALPLMALLVFGFTLISLILYSWSVSGWVDHTDRLIGESVKAEKRIIDLETGLRGYIITADPLFLEPFMKARESIIPLLDEFNGKLVEGSPRRETIKKIREAYISWSAYADSIVRAVRRGELPRNLYIHLNGKERMDSIRELFSKLLDELTTLRNERVQHLGTVTKYVLVLTIGLGFIFGALIALLAQRQVRRVMSTYEMVLSEVNSKGKELAFLATELKRSNDELEQFAAVASQDLKEPLRMVKIYVQFLKDKYSSQLDAKAKDYIEFAVEGANRMQNLIEAILSYSKVSQGTLELIPVDCTKVVAQAVENLKATIDEEGAVLDLQSLPIVKGDPIQLCQVFQNLIANALKFRREKPVISIRSRKEEGRWVVSVADNGLGIDKKYQGRIFELFQRLHKRTEYPGTGIGLSVCKKIIEQHGGKIWVDSELGNGSTFYFTLLGV